MKKEDLENNKKLLESDYDDMTLYVESFKIGAKAWVVNKNYIEEETEEIEDMVVVYAFHRRDNEKEYNSFADEDDLMMAYGGDYDVSGEFITDDDIVYVFLNGTEE